MSIDKKLPGKKISYARKTLIAVASATVMMAGGVSSAVAIGDVNEVRLGFFDCLGLMLRNSDQHEAKCGGGNSTSPGTLVPEIYRKEVVPLPPMALPVEDECPTSKGVEECHESPESISPE